MQTALNGLLLGVAYALVAVGFVFLYNNTRFLNFAHGDLVTLGAYLGYAATVTFGLPPFVGLIFVLGLLGIIGLGMERLLARPLAQRALFLAVIATLGFGLMVRAVLFLIWGGLPRVVAPLLGPGGIAIFGLTADTQQVVIFAFAAVILAMLYWIYNRTLLGLQLRATAENPDTARLMGVNVDWIVRWSFVISAMLAGLAGMLLAPLYFVSLDLGWTIALSALTAAIVGGFGSLTGAAVGAVLVGLLELFSATFVSPDYRTIAVFVALIAVLVLRPHGIFGSRLEERA
jgi:branched-chain amino acid transport system permease protein